MRFYVDKKRMKSDKGSVLMEAIICLPVLLLLSLGVAQFAHIWYCRTIVHYAAYSAARATLTAPAGTAQELRAARSAAELICAPIAFMNPDSGRDFSLPGITPPAPGEGNTVQGSGAVRDSGNILDVSLSSGGTWQRTVDVRMKVPLLFPFAGQVIGKMMKVWQDGALDIESDTPSGAVQHFAGEWTSRIILHEQCSIVKPFVSSWSDF